MIPNEVIGRTQEWNRLEQCMQEEKAQLIIVYGRRRIGKTFLINQFFSDRFDFKLTGVYQAPLDEQLANFSREMTRQTGISHERPASWGDAFEQLREYLSSLPGDAKHVVFLDEMPWLDSPRSGFLSAFEYFWNDYGCTLNHLVLIVCGSASSWMTTNIAENKGGLFNRQTCSLYLQPFTLQETESYLRFRGIEWSRYDIAGCYMVLGGIPFYLSLLQGRMSPAENIDNLLFRKRAELWAEFTHLYHTLFTNSEQYIKIAEVLSRKRMGYTRDELAQLTGLSQNGRLSKMLTDLELSGFIEISPYYGRKKKQTLYRLKDYYSLFYFRFLYQKGQRDERFWSHTMDHPSRTAWAGFTFEQLCRDHITQIKQKLGIAGVLSEEYSWFIHPDPLTDPDEKGAQIDLLIDRRDHVTNICEMKYSINEYEIDKEYDMILRNKIAAFRKATGTRNTLQLTMITTYGIHRNKYSSLVTSEVRLDDLFATPVF